MRSFTNKGGERIEVQDEHLDIAIKIKEELQKQSPSRKVSWVKHRKMMEAEGFYDSENSERYRCMIKAEQSSRGVLLSLPKYVDMVSENKLESIKEEIGQIQFSKLEAREEFLKLNRMKREWTKDILLVEGVERAIRDMSFSEIKHEPFLKKDKPKKQMVACISDLHYGALVDVEGFVYNTEIATQLLDEYANKVIMTAIENNVEHVHVMVLGDMIEHTYMRTSNTFNAEKTLSDQIIEAGDLIINFIQKVSKYVDSVTYSGINGNHDRLNGNKNDSLYADDAVGIINKIVQLFIKYNEKMNNVEYIEAEPYHHIVNMNHKNFLFVHGDKTAMAKQSVLAEQSTLYGISLDGVFGGHFHHFAMKEVSQDKYVVTFGSIKGSDEYTLKTINTKSSRSQGVILVDEFGNFEVKQIKL